MLIFYHSFNKALSTSILVVEELTQLLRALTALVDHCLILSHHMVANRQLCVTPDPEDMIPSSISCEHWTHRCKYMQNKHIQ